MIRRVIAVPVLIVLATLAIPLAFVLHLGTKVLAGLEAVAEAVFAWAD